MFRRNIAFETLVGKTLSKIDQLDDSIVFTIDNGEQYQQYHDQDCCESVSVEDVAGDLADLLHTPILQAYESSSNKNPEGYKSDEDQDSFTWTFYRLATIKGTVTIRWYGESNGYYSESVYFKRIK